MSAQTLSVDWEDRDWLADALFHLGFDLNFL